MSIYEDENPDYTVTKGDTLNIPLQFVDSDGDNVDITAFQIKFSVKNSLTNSIETSFSKSHDFGGADLNDGIYYSIDTNTPAQLVPFLTQTNQVIIVLSYTDTSSVDPGVYPYDVEIERNDSPTKFTIKGNLIITEEVTASV